ncbi:MAG: AAA family ATPase [bacterium]|nr:AAA family ATPase [bacterium]
MPNEIERRFIPTRWSSKHSFLFTLPRVNIRQGYFELPIKDKSLRVRISDNEKGELTLKSGKGIERPEDPHPLSVDYAGKLMELCSHYLEKVRHIDNRWEIDFFEPPLNGLVLLEIELKSRDEEFEKPKYIEEWIEVTDSLTNHHLARLATQLREHKLPAIPYIYSHIFSRVPRVVITGGPCSGKTDIMALLSKTRPDLQCVPEVASIVIGQLNIKPKKELNDFFQRLIHNTQSLFEETSLQYAVIEGQSGLILDRGLPDGAAYFDNGIPQYESVLKTSIEQEYSRYKLVLCLDVAPRDTYELKKYNNPSRSETYEEACEKGNKVRQVWQNHPNFIFIPNDGGWNEKIRKVQEAIDRVLK